eukprot:scaffold53436_cov28-Prasinocladus_malaysianus.AAC.3
MANSKKEIAPREMWNGRESEAFPDFDSWHVHHLATAVELRQLVRQLIRQLWAPGIERATLLRHLEIKLAFEVVAQATEADKFFLAKGRQQ